MDISRNAAKAAVSRSPTWSSCIIKTASAPSAAVASQKTLCTRGFATSASRQRKADGQGDRGNVPSTIRGRIGYSPIHRRGLQNHSGNDASSSNSHPRYEGGIEPSPISVENLPQLSYNSASSEVSQLSIRDRLRLWEAENLARGGNAFVVHERGDLAPDGTFGNAGMRILDSQHYRTEEETLELAQSSLPLFETEDLVGFGNERSFLLQGDLVELRTTDGIRIELAIFIREIGRQCQFYTVSGRWIHKSSRNAKFFVPNFVSPEEISPLIQFLPDAAVPEAIQDTLQNFENSLPRDVGAPLVKKMIEFSHEVDAIYREHSKVLDDAFNIVALHKKTQHVSLPELTKQLLMPGTTVRNEDIAPSALYAVYRSVMNQMMGISIEPTGNVRSWGRFEIAPKNIVNTIHVASVVVRRWQENKIADLKRGLPFNVDFDAFIDRARSAIDISRKGRAVTRNGQVGPIEGRATDDPLKTSIKDVFAPQDFVFIRFILCWAAWQTFSLSSPMNAIGSTILRATGRYNDLVLDQPTGWQFLQEIGILTPWEIDAPYRLRMPEYGYSRSFKTQTDAILAENEKAIQRIKEARLKKSIAPTDELKSLRKDWDNLTVYCIDDTNAHEIDDGVSVEPTDVEDEYWIHVHVADPASLFKCRSPLAEAAEEMVQTIYMPDQVATMFPDETVQAKLSMAPGRPTLTFSAKINSKGEILDHKVTPGTIRKVVYLTPATLAAVVGINPPRIENIVSVGDSDVATAYNEGVMSRSLASPDDLSATDKENLKLLVSVGARRRNYAALRGSINFDLPRPVVTVKLDKALGMDEEINLRHSRHYLKDPFISLEIIYPTSGPSTAEPVANLMCLGSEIAAIWCKERNIPVIYRVTQQDPNKPDPGTYFRANVLPYILRGEEPPMNVVGDYVKVLGVVLPSSTPGPHVALGVDAYTKCTSPLRRYGDLVTHWQIEAALLYEAKTGESLVGSEKHDYLPFSKADIDELIPKMESREKAILEQQGDAERAFALQALLRAWKFGEAELPETFEFTVGTVTREWIGGDIEKLGLRCTMKEPPDFIDIEKVAVGDTFEVRIKEINPYGQWFSVEPVGKDQYRRVGVEDKRMMGDKRKTSFWSFL